MGIGDSFGGQWDGDIYRCSDDSGTNHAVVIAGYDDEGGYWIVKNSWGTSFGDNGYFKVGYGECAIEADVYYAYTVLPAVVREWVARYDHGNDPAASMAVDAEGNAYVTGYSMGSGSPPEWQPDYVTIKYDNDGNELWVATYNGPRGITDAAMDLAVDDEGNVYVTGSSIGLGTEQDYATVKYDGDGNELWVARYDGPASGADMPWDIAIDDWGNAYVTGYSVGLDNTDDDYATIKYDSDGNELWVSRYDGPASGWDRAQMLDVDQSGNVYVTGASHHTGIQGEYDFDYATIKYDSDGNELWVSRHDSPVGSYNWAAALATDDSGNTYVTGWSGSATDIDYVTIKYDSNGNQQWLAQYDGPAAGVDMVEDLALDNSGDVYVTGSSTGSGDKYDYATIKYDSNGNELWIDRYGSPGIPDGGCLLAIDEQDNAYVTGTAGSFGDFTTIKYDGDGERQWVAKYGTNANDYAQGLAVDGEGNVFVAGFSQGFGTSNDYVTVKYSQPGFVPAPETGAVGGVAEPPDVAAASGSSSPPFAAPAGAAVAGVALLAACGWYMRRRLRSTR